MEILTSILKVVGAAVTGGGTLYAVFSLIGLGTALKQHNGPDIQSNLWGLAGAACILAAGVLVLTVNFG